MVPGNPGPQYGRQQALAAGVGCAGPVVAVAPVFQTGSGSPVVQPPGLVLALNTVAGVGVAPPVSVLSPSVLRRWWSERAAPKRSGHASDFGRLGD